MKSNYNNLNPNYYQDVETDNFMQELLLIAEPLLMCNAFNRLDSITFLGILSPKFNNIINASSFGKNIKYFVDSRKNHSIGVALIALDLVKHLNLSLKAQRYAVAWGLLHDIATWPLSHTGEPAFSDITEVSSSSLRERMIKGSKELPSSLTIQNELKEMNIDPVVLLSLFQKAPLEIDCELQLLHQTFNSPITPDSLDGIWRSGFLFGINVPNPKEIIMGFYRDLFNVVVKKEYSKIIMKFWEQKSVIYEKIINRYDIILWESSWSAALKDHFQYLGLVDSLLIDENELINKILEYGLIKKYDFYRYKPPLSYFIDNLNKGMIKRDYPLQYLNNILRKGRKKEYKYGGYRIESSP